MGEKLLARRALSLLRETIGSGSREAKAVIEWSSDHRDWLWPGGDIASGKKRCLSWRALSKRVDEIDTDGAPDSLFASVDLIASLLSLKEFDRGLLTAAAAFTRLPRLRALRFRLVNEGYDLADLIARLAGAMGVHTVGRVRRSQAVALGLIAIERDSGGRELVLDWQISRLLDGEVLDETRVIDALVGKPQKADLTRPDFVEIETEVDLLVRLLKGALGTRTKGVNILIHGPPGTGKTELARTLAAEAGAQLFAVGEADEDGDEPTRYERLSALNRAQRLLANKADSILLFDEMEDLFAEASTSASGAHRSGSKIYINRLLEHGALPVIWTSNALGCVDRAHLRRLSFILRLDHASPNGRLRIAARAGEAVGAAAAVAGLTGLLSKERESASVARIALRTAALAGGSGPDAEAAGRALLIGLRGGRSLAPGVGDGEVNLALYQAGQCVAGLIERLSADDAPSNFSLLMTGPPGTGKTALAAHLARRLDRPLLVKRTSDLLSKWVGETEANIADAFAEARDSGSVLLFDEADSLLQDRADARQSWEITQVNEMLTWMDTHPLPFIAATNFERRLDPAAMRRFVFKLALQALSGPALDEAFECFFNRAAPRQLQRLVGLSPGDFAVVQRQLQFRGPTDDAALLAMLQGELDAKPGQPARLGF